MLLKKWKLDISYCACSVIAFNQLKSSNTGGSFDGIISFFEPFLNNQVKLWFWGNTWWSQLSAAGSGHCYRAPSADSVLWPGHQDHPHLPHLRRRWHGQWTKEKFFSSSLFSSWLLLDIWDSWDPNPGWCLELPDRRWLWNVDDIQDQYCGPILRCRLPSPRSEGTPWQWSNWGH